MKQQPSGRTFCKHSRRAALIEAIERRVLLSVATGNAVLPGNVYGTAGSFHNQGNVIDKAVDGDFNTYFDAPTATGGYVAVDLGAPETLAEIDYSPRTGWANRMVGGRFEASNSKDFSTGVETLFTITQTPSQGLTTAATVSSTTAYRYVRYVGPANSYCNISDMQFFGGQQALTTISNNILYVNGTTGDDVLKVNYSEEIDDDNPGSPDHPVYVQNFLIETELGGGDESGAGSEIKTSIANNDLTTIIVNSFDGSDHVEVTGLENNISSFGTFRHINVIVRAGNGPNFVSAQVNNVKADDPGTGASISITSGSGDDTLRGRGGSFVNINGGDGNNHIDTLAFNSALSATLTAGSGNDVLFAGFSGENGLTVDMNAGTGQDIYTNSDPAAVVTAEGYGPVAYDSSRVIGSVSVLGGSSSDLITVFLDLDNNGMLSAGDTTQLVHSGSTFSFDNLPGYDGNGGPQFTVGVVVPNGDVLLTPSDGTTITGTSSLMTGDDFVLSPAASITGSVSVPGGNSSDLALVYLDLDHDGTLSEGDQVQVVPVGSSFSFDDLPGYLASGKQKYDVGIQVPDGYVLLKPSTGTTYKDVANSKATADFVLAPVLTGALIGTAGSYQNGGNTIAKAVDGNLSTYFDAPSANGNWIGYDFGANGAVVSALQFASRAKFESRMIGGIFQASNSSTFSSGVVNLYTTTSAVSSGKLTTVSVTNTKSYRYYRYLAPAGSYGNIGELSFLGTGGFTALYGNPIGTDGSYKDLGNTIYNATDLDLTTFFDGPTANGNWVGLDLGFDQSVSMIRFAPRDGFASRMVGGIFQASTTEDFSSGVTNLYTIKTAPPVGTFTSIALMIPKTAEYFRYLSPTGSYGNIAEFELFG